MPTKAKGRGLLQPELMQSPGYSSEAAAPQVPCGFPTTTSGRFCYCDGGFSNTGFSLTFLCATLEHLCLPT